VRRSALYDSTAAAVNRAHQVQVQSCQDLGRHRCRQQVTRTEAETNTIKRMLLIGENIFMKITTNTT